MKYLKWAFKDNIDHRDNQKFEIGKVITCDTQDPNNSDQDKCVGLNFTNEEWALRWMSKVILYMKQKFLKMLKLQKLKIMFLRLQRLLFHNERND